MNWKHICLCFDYCAMNKRNIDNKLPIYKLTSKEKVLEYAGTGGDDYELAFTTNADTFELVQEMAKGINLNISAVGTVVTGNSVVCRVASGNWTPLKELRKGYRHF